MTTIYALSTVFGKSGVAVFRVSGPDANSVFDLFNIKQKIKPRHCHFAKIFDGKILIDEVILLYFSSPQSFTGEDVVELQCHGSIAVIKYICDRLDAIFKLAEPGEFTKRAFLNGKFDLTKAEGISDLINATTSAQIEQTSRQLLGNLKNEYENLRDKIIKVLANIEAYIDFPDEEIPDEILEELKTDTSAIIASIENHLKDSNIGQRIRDGFQISIIGPPNSGKSTLLNYFAKRDFAIVTNTPGTTRDTLELKLDINGYPAVMIDTAGIRSTEEEIEKKGIEKAINSAKNADIVISMHDINKLSGQDFLQKDFLTESNVICVASKADKNDKTEIIFKDKAFLPISVHKNCNLEVLKDKIFKKLSSFCKEPSIITNQRQRNSLKSANLYLKNAEKAQKTTNPDLEIIAEELRLAANQLATVTGFIKVDHILDKIFSSFCIGK